MCARLLTLAALVLCMSITSGCYYLVSKAGGANFSFPPKKLNEICQNEKKRGKEELACNLISAAFEGIEDGYVDHHVHSIGFFTGDGDRTRRNEPPTQGGPNPYINPKRLDWLYKESPEEPYSFLKRVELYIKTVGLKTAFVIPDIDKTNEQFRNRLEALVKSIENVKASPTVSIKLLAFDAYYKKESNGPDKTLTDIYMPNSYVIDTVNELNENKFDGRKVFEAVGSVHPFRSDWKKELNHLKAHGVTYIKWLPSTMGIDPSSKDLDDIYKEMARLDMVIIGHTGYEEATEVYGDNHRLGNPLLWERALVNKVKVLMAHSGYKGVSCQPGPGREPAWNADLFREMMQKEEYRGLLFGDISALIFIDEGNKPKLHTDAINKKEEKECKATLKTDQSVVLVKLLKEMMEEDSLFTGRLVNSSDYPLPGIKMIKPTDFFRNNDFLTDGEATALDLIYKYNPFLFDFVLKRTISHPDDIEAKIKGEGSVRRLPKETFGKLENLPGFQSH